MRWVEPAEKRDRAEVEGLFTIGVLANTPLRIYADWRFGCNYFILMGFILN